MYYHDDGDKGNLPDCRQLQGLEADCKGVEHSFGFVINFSFEKGCW